jgi:mono/diheme cytochrome c family protein
MPRKLVTAAVLGAAVLGLATACKLAAQDRARTVRDGVYSPAQAVRGERVFSSVCMNCHEIAEFTAAGAYLEDVDGRPLWETFEYISAEMPEDDPGSLRPEDYADVLAYIFSAYGLPTGETDLPIDQEPLEVITIVRAVLPGS